MTNHTSGPWKYRKLHADGNIITEGDYWEIFTYEYDVAAFFSRGAPIRKEADARLIAAAPELLEALEWLVLAFDVGDMMHTTLNGRGYAALVESRLAIARATYKQDTYHWTQETPLPDFKLRCRDPCQYRRHHGCRRSAPRYLSLHRKASRGDDPRTQ